MDKMDFYKKLSEPGLWFVRTKHSTSVISRYIYDLAVELGLYVEVYSATSKIEIQNEVIDILKEKCLEKASDENERNWLEQELREYNAHGFFSYPEELNDYVPDGSFWEEYCHFGKIREFDLYNFPDKLYLIDCPSELSYYFFECDKEFEFLKALPLIEKEAIEYRNSVIVFLSPTDSCIDDTFVNNHLLFDKES